MKLFLEVIVLCYGTAVVSTIPANQSRSDQTYEYEKLHRFGEGKRLIPSFRRLAYENPEPLPSTTVSGLAMFREPFPKLYQGFRRRNHDRRVFRKEFDYPATDIGHRLMCESLVHCRISHVAVETEEGIPIILRGGVGYYHFSIIVRANPGNPLKGTIRVYCNKDPDEIDGAND